MVVFHFILILKLLLYLVVPSVNSRGLLLLYRPKDVSNDCVLSHKLRYDISFGMGMSDTITLVFRNMKEIDYQCVVEIVTTEHIYILLVIHFPNSLEANCEENKHAFTILKKNKCLGVCSFIENKDYESQFMILPVETRVRFRFLSNSSINADMDANVYQVTATAARMRDKDGCVDRNETLCLVRGGAYCFTNGVVCDGIKNCGVSDWYDERKSECLTPLDFIGYAPVVAVLAVIICSLLVACHFMLRYLPMSASSYFIFNANEDNRLCIDPVFRAPDHMRTEIERPKRISIIPVSSSSSDEQGDHAPMDKSADVKSRNIVLQPTTTVQGPEEQVAPKEEKPVRRKTTMRTMTEMLHQRLRSVTSRAPTAPPPSPPTVDYI